MQITSMCKALALHEIFDDRGIGAGGRLPMAEVERAWAASGLRQSDLAETLLDARVTGEFTVCETTDAGSAVMLTELGYAHAQRDLSNLSDIEALIRAYATLALARRRQPSGQVFGRRRADRLPG